jgi:hypothetical protein
MLVNLGRLWSENMDAVAKRVHGGLHVSDKSDGSSLSECQFP